MIKEYLEHIKTNRGYSPATVISYERELRAFVAYQRRKDANARWSQISPNNIDEYVTDLVGLGMATATIKRKVSVIRSLFNYMRYKGMITNNPAQYTTTPKAAKTLPKTVETQAISAAIADVTNGITTRLQIAIIAETGIRISELLNIQCEDIDTTTRTIKINGKGAKEREVNYGLRTEELLTGYLTSQTGALFITATRDTERNIFKAIQKHSKQKKCSPHVIRHTFASEMTRNGAQLQAIAKILGHESTKTTEKYSHMMTATQAENYRQYAPQY